MRGVALGAAATFVYASLTASSNVTVPIFLIDAMLLLFAITASRFSFRALRRFLPSVDGVSGQRVVIYGAGDGGELILRELLHNKTLERVPVAFLDDDPRKSGRMLHGLPISAPNGAGSIAKVCRAYGARELLVSTGKLPAERLRQVIEECEAARPASLRISVTNVVSKMGMTSTSTGTPRTAMTLRDRPPPLKPASSAELERKKPTNIDPQSPMKIVAGLRL